MNIYSCIDSTNMEKILILFYSIIVNTKNIDDIKFYLIVDKLYDFDIPDIIKCRLHIKKLETDSSWIKIMKDFKDNFYIDLPWCKNDMNFARFFVFHHFPELERAIYIDWDMIVLSDINELKESYNKFSDIIVARLTIEQSIFTACFIESFKHNTNINTMYTNSKNCMLRFHKINKISEKINTTYEDLIHNKSFNAGIFIVSKKHFDNKFMMDHINNLIEIQKSTKCFKFGTQTILNLMLIKNKSFIDKEWNYIPNISDEKMDNNKIKIMHWNGSNKPWITRFDPNNQIWWDYYKKFLILTNREDELNTNKRVFKIKL